MEIDKSFSSSEIQSLYKNDRPFLYGWGLLFLGILALPFIKIDIFIFDYFFSKWVIVYLIACFFSIFFVCNKQLLVLPKISNDLLTILAVLFLMNLLNHWVFNISLLSPAFFDRCIFIFLTISFFDLFHKSLDPRFLIMSIAAGLFLFLLTCLPDLLKIMMNIEKSEIYLEKNFGNINMSGEFVGVSFAILLASKKHFEAILMKRFFDLLSYFSIIYCYYASSRSVVIALLLVAASLFFLKIISLKEIIKLILVPFFLVFFTRELSSLFLTSQSPVSVFAAEYIKEGSTSVRWGIILETLKLIKEHPFGVGPGGFLFGFVPYLKPIFPGLSEGNIAQSPHNEYLRFFAEDGIIFSFLFSAFIILFVYKNAQIIKEKTRDHPTILAFFIFLAVQSLFQFPLINAVPFFLTTCFTGYLLAVVYPKTVCLKNMFVFISLTIFMIFFTGALVTSEVLAFLYPTSARHLKMACSLNDTNYIACVRQAEAEMMQNDYDAARKTLIRELTKRPHNFVALSVLAKLEGAIGNSEKMCLHLKNVDDYFNRQSSFHNFLEENCKHFSVKIR